MCESWFRESLKDTTWKVSDRALTLVQAWSPRKRDLFKENHLHKAWERLQAQGWFEMKG